MEVGLMQRQWVEYTKSLFMEGFLDSQFIELQKLQDEGNPDFVVEVVSLFFEDSERLLNDLTRALDASFPSPTDVRYHNPTLLGSLPSRCVLKTLRLMAIYNGLKRTSEMSLVWTFKRLMAMFTSLKEAVLGAQRVKNVCITLRSFCEEQNIEGCLRYLQQLKQETCLVKNKLENLFRMEQQIVAAGGSIPTTELLF